MKAYGCHMQIRYKGLQMLLLQFHSSKRHLSKRPAHLVPFSAHKRSNSN